MALMRGVTDVTPGDPPEYRRNIAAGYRGRPVPDPTDPTNRSPGGTFRSSKQRPGADARLLSRWSEAEPVGPTLGPAASPPPPTARRRRRRHRKLRITLITIGAAIVVLAGSAFGYLEYLNHEIGRIKVGDLKAASTNGTENILLVGSTSRCVLTQQNPAFGLCSQGVTGENSDVVMLLHLDTNNHKASILSLPRDLFVPNARTTGANKIDAALYQGPTQLVNAIEDDFGIPIQHYVELNFDSFQNVVNALGGLKMYFPMPVFDAESSLNIPTAGCQSLNGFQALAVVRARHLQYKPPTVTTNNHAYWPQDPQSDLSRIRRDHEFLRVLASEVSKRGLSNPFTDRSLVAAVASQLQVDSQLSLSDMVNLVLTFHDVNPGQAPEETMPVLVHSGLDYYYKGYNYGSVELPSEPQDTQAIDQFLGISAGTDALTGHALPAPGNITVAVLNGSGVYNQAAKTSAALQALGFDVVATGDTTSGGSPSETVVTYPAGNSAAEAAAEAVVHQLSGAVVMTQATNSTGSGSTTTTSTVGGAMVTVMTGSDFSVNPPAASPPAATSTTSGTTAKPGVTTTTTSASAATLSTPTPAAETLAPFDPRSCTATGGEGP